MSITHAAVITITYDATQGVSGLAGASQVYLHSGGNDVTGTLDGSCWKYVVGNWGQQDGIGKMQSLGNNRWSISIDPKAYYSQATNGPVIGASIKRIGLVFRNETGTLEGKDVNNSDIFIDLSGASPTAHNSDGSIFGGVTITNATNFFSATSTVARYLVVGHVNDTLKVIDSSNFANLRAVKMIADSAIIGATGFTRHPSNGKYYVILRFQTLENRVLATVDPNSGAVSVIGNLNDRFANIVFLPSGRMFGVTGEGAFSPESLFEIDITSGATTFIRALGNGSGGESIGYCPLNGRIYHRSGIGTQVFEFIDTVNFDVFPVSQASNGLDGETFSMLFIGGKNFIASTYKNSTNYAYYVDTNGVFTLKQIIGQAFKGMEFLSCTRNIIGNLSFCTGSSTVLSATPGASSYQWYKDGALLPGQTNTSITVTSPGNYNCMFSDLCGTDSLPASLTVQEKALPSVVISGANSFCSGSSIILTGSGGGTSQWYKNGVAIVGQTTSSITVNSPGLYNMTKTNTNGCSDSAAVGKLVLVNPKPVLTVIAARNLKCNSDNSGSIDVDVTSGTSPYGYAWSNSSTAASLSNLAAGTYQLIVTDSKTCKDTVSATLTEPLALSLSISSSNVTCFGETNGSAIATASGGSGSYTYLWSNSNASGSISNLSAGTYSLTISDDSLCTLSDTAVITEPSVLNGNLVISDVTCNGANDGTATANTFGGTPPYAYTWSSGGGANSFQANLSPGSYLLTVSDAALCSYSSPFAIAEPNAISISFVHTDVTCNGGADGSAAAITTGGTGALSYVWSNGAGTSFSIFNLSASTYSVTVTDANLCTYVDSVTVSEPPPLNAQINQTNVSCNGLADGSITAIASGGVGSYIFSWSNGDLTPSTLNLQAGTYDLFLSDTNSCSYTTAVTIIQPNALQLDTVVTSANSGLNNGTINISVSGGVSPYAFSWSNGAVSEDISNLAPGVYGVVVTDANGCLISNTNIALFGVGVNAVHASLGIEVFPNPSKGAFKIFAPEKMHVLVFNSLNQEVAAIDLEKNKATEFNEALQPGIYYLRGTAENSSINKKIVITR